MEGGGRRWWGHRGGVTGGGGNKHAGASVSSRPSRESVCDDLGVPPTSSRNKSHCWVHLFLSGNFSRAFYRVCTRSRRPGAFDSQREQPCRVRSTTRASLALEAAAAAGFEWSTRRGARTAHDVPTSCAGIVRVCLCSTFFLVFVTKEDSFYVPVVWYSPLFSSVWCLWCIRRDDKRARRNKGTIVQGREISACIDRERCSPLTEPIIDEGYRLEYTVES